MESNNNKDPDQQQKMTARLRHDLRTPLNAVIGYSEIMREDIDDMDETNPNIHDFIIILEKIHLAGNNMVKKVNEILNPAKFESLEKPIDVKQLGTELLCQFRPFVDELIKNTKILNKSAKKMNQESFLPDIEKISSSAYLFLNHINDFLNKSKSASDTQINKFLHAPPSASSLLKQTIYSVKDEDKKNLELPHGNILVVDDNDMNRDILCRHIKRQGHGARAAENGYQALDMVKKYKPDLVLLDIMMPGIDGYQVLERLKDNKSWRDIPVIMISALDEMDSVVRCIKMGAEDYLPKPFDPILLKARIGACLEKKRLRDMEQAYLKQLQIEQEKSEGLLLNILPKQIAERLKQGQTTIADNFDEVTVLFIDLVGFTDLSSRISSEELVALLNRVFSAFDKLADQHDLEKIKTIGDAYMAVGGLPVPKPNHAENVAQMALDVLKEMKNLNNTMGTDFQIRIGINTGPVMAGVIGTNKFSYDLWGETVNIASRMESHGIKNSIQVSHETYKHLKDKYLLKKRGTINVKGKGEMTTYILLKRRIE